MMKPNYLKQISRAAFNYETGRKENLCETVNYLLNYLHRSQVQDQVPFLCFPRIDKTYRRYLTAEYLVGYKKGRIVADNYSNKIIISSDNEKIVKTSSPLHLISHILVQVNAERRKMGLTEITLVAPPVRQTPLRLVEE